MRPARRFAALAITASMFTLPLLSASAAPLTKPEPIDATAFRPVPTFAPTATSRSERSKVVAVIVDTFHYRFPSPKPRPQIDTPAVEPKSMTVVTPFRPSDVVPGGRRISGKVSWYCLAGVSKCARGYPSGSMVAAAGPRLRIAMGGGAPTTAPDPWRGKRVNVCVENTTRCVRVTLVDWCQCYYKQGHEKLIDLYNKPWSDLGKPSRVTVSW